MTFDARLKRCPICGDSKPRADFPKNGKNKVKPHCKPCHSAQVTAYQKRNREARRNYWREWYRRKFGEPKARLSKEQLAAKKKAYSQQPSRKERDRESKRRYNATHPHMMAEVCRRRQVAQNSATPAWANRFFLQEAYDLARRRTKALGEPWVVDHIVPIKSGIVCGLHVPANLCVITRSLNRQKSNRWWPDMPTEGNPIEV